MANRYYSVEDIIADGQRLPCNFEIAVPGLGYLQGKPDDDIEEGTKLDLPLWLAEMLAMSGISADSSQSFVTLREPPMFSEKVLNALKSEATSVNLSQLSPVFFKLAERWMAIFGDQELADIINQTFKKRANTINDFASNPRGQMSDSKDFLSGLDAEEVALYKQVSESTRSMRRFMSNEAN